MSGPRRHAATIASAALMACAIAPVLQASPWQSLAGGVDNQVLALAVDETGGVYAGGMERHACAAPATPGTCTAPLAADFIIRWDESGWHGMQPALNSFVGSIATHAGGGAYVGGIFTTAGSLGSPVNGIAAWSGTSWGALGTGLLPAPLSSTVVALTTDAAGAVYAGGHFESMDGVRVNNIAKWDGAGWTSLGNGLDGLVKEIVVARDGTVYAGGDFLGACTDSTCTAAAPLGNGYIARWDGTSWLAVGGGLDDAVQALALDQHDNLYVGGDMRIAGGTTWLQSIGRWNGTAWSAVGNGFDNPVDALAVDSAGRVYAGGRFLHTCAAGTGGTCPTGTSVNHIARWDGSSWESLGTGIPTVLGTASVSSLVADPGGYLYLGGAFTSISDVAAWNVARTLIAVAPGPPRTASAQAGDGSAAVTWQAPASDGAGAITTYTVTSEPDGRTCTWSAGPLTCTVTGLRNGTAYTFAVTATNAAGTGPASRATDTVTPGAPVTPAFAPQGGAGNPAPPRLTGLAPIHGPWRGGTRVTIRGAGLAGTTSVALGSARARIIRRSDGAVVAMTPRHAPGRVAVTLTADGLSVTRARAFRYTGPPTVHPRVTG